jgi:hypothetical protein
LTEKASQQIIEVKPISTSTKEPSQLNLPLTQRINRSLVAILKGYGISEAKALEIANTCKEPYVKKILEYVDQKIQTGKVKDIPAYTVSAIERNYQTVKTSFELKKEETEKQKLAAQKAQQEAENKKKEQERQEREKQEGIQKAIASLPESEKKALRKEAQILVEAGIKAGKYNEFGKNLMIQLEMEQLYKEKHFN